MKSSGQKKSGNKHASNSHRSQRKAANYRSNLQRRVDQLEKRAATESGIVVTRLRKTKRLLANNKG